MCGIFGVVVKPGSRYDRRTISRTLGKIAQISECRGKDSSGICFRKAAEEQIKVIKGAIPISKLIRSDEYMRDLEAGIDQYEGGYPFTAMGHARLVTNGTQMQHQNNQPVIKDGVISIHNGIIVNVDELWEDHSLRDREYEIDTEIMNSLVEFHDRSSASIISSTIASVGRIHGTIAAAFLFDYRNEMVLYTNNGSLFTLTNNNDVVVFASEKYFLQLLIEQVPELNELHIEQVKPDNGLHLDFEKFKITHFESSATEIMDDSKPACGNERFSIELSTINDTRKKPPTIVDVEQIRSGPQAIVEKKLLEYNIDSIREINRCTRCILPETFPFIEFDDDGVCNYCRNYKLINQPKPIEDLHALVEPYKDSNGKPDCIVPFSGGRDSTFVLHMVKEVLGLNPIAFTYDWGMVTDLARRNIARVCGKLGVENIIVAADLDRKREYIRKNVAAWLRKPSLGMIPLFMAGDKYFYHYTKQLKQQTGIKLNIWGINTLETTQFKVGFAGVEPAFDKKFLYSISFGHKLKLFKYIGRQFITNPGYINSSNRDSIGSFITRFRYSHEDYYPFFDYYQWKEDEIINLIIDEYDWETAIDTKSTWRIGDGTASFYNYIYFTVAGFSEVDTFRSNQIREGLISRCQALDLCYEENFPRYENLKWYTTIIGIPYKYTIRQINQIPKLYLNK